VYENFKFFAMRYLNDWCSDDRAFFHGLASTDKSEQLKVLKRAATYYGVARTLKHCGEKNRLECALDALKRMRRPDNDGAAIAAVCGLAKDLQLKYGKNVISAASKFLWLEHRWPVVIYDSRAVACLGSCRRKFNPYDYADYRNAWQSEFAKRAGTIRAACDQLHRAREFSLADSLSDDEFAETIRSPWFHERVFDKFLWWNADS
jgi:hypothetical protein